MGVIEQEMKELRQMIKYYDAGKINDDQVKSKIAIYSQMEKREKLMLQAFITAAKNGKPILNRIYRSQLLGDGTAIPLTIKEIEMEEILCPHLEALITRDKCLEHEGDPEWADSCKGCEIGIANKKLLCPEVQEYV